MGVGLVGKNKWYVITGGPSSGKTTLLAELERLGHKTVPELARQIIEEGLLQGKTLEQIRRDEHSFQKSILQKATKREQQYEKQIATFFDRGVHDVAAYLAHYNHELDEGAHKLFQNSTYQKVFLLDPLPEFHKDHARSETPEFRDKIHKQLAETYTSYGMEPVHVPVLPVAERVQFILDNL